IAFSCVFSFFFQAEDGIRDFHVTGVQTCALPICEQTSANLSLGSANALTMTPASATLVRCIQLTYKLDDQQTATFPDVAGGQTRSEERRVGKEWGSRQEA